MPNRFYSKGMVPSDLWESVKKRFSGSSRWSVKEKDFYSKKFALWIDFRTHPDNDIYGVGLPLTNAQDGIKIEMKRKLSGSSTMTCYMFVVADALMEVMKSNLKSILY